MEGVVGEDGPEEEEGAMMRGEKVEDTGEDSMVRKKRGRKVEWGAIRDC